jgi:hypothetical protein
MITGAHIIIYSKDAEADRKFLRMHFKFPSIDVGDGWLVFGLPPSEIAIHPSARNNKHELYFLCTDIHGFIEEMKAAKVRCSPVTDQAWGHLTSVSLPGGGKVGVYEPLHKRPRNPSVEMSQSRKPSIGRKRK